MSFSGSFLHGNGIKPLRGPPAQSSRFLHPRGVRYALLPFKDIFASLHLCCVVFCVLYACLAKSKLRVSRLAEHTPHQPFLSSLPLARVNIVPTRKQRGNHNAVPFLRCDSELIINFTLLRDEREF